MDGDSAQAVVAEEVGHEVGVPLGAAEGEGALAGAIAVLLEGVLGALGHQRLTMTVTGRCASPPRTPPPPKHFAAGTHFH